MPYAAVGPTATLELAGSFVVQATVAEVEAGVTLTLEMTGGVVSATNVAVTDLSSSIVSVAGLAPPVRSPLHPRS